MSDEIAQDPNAQAPKKKSKLPIIIVGGALIIVAALIFFYWLFFAQYRVNTNDAYVEGNIVEVFPRVQGTYQTIYVNDTDHVEEGQLLASLDPTDYQIQFDEAQANLASTLRNVQQMFDQVNELSASLEQQMVYLNQAQMHFAHRQALVGIGGVSREDFEDSQTDLLAAEAKFIQIEESLKKAQSQTYNTTVLNHPQVISAIENLKQSWVELNYTQIKAPCSGFIAQKSAQIGETASTSHAALSVVPLDDLWIVANFKESQLTKLRIGQAVKVKTDTYKNDFIFDGILLGISPGTGSVFSILPPQNATGNWIKIVQRVPVRIGLRRSEIKSHPLRLGLSTEISVDVRHQEGSVLSQTRPTQVVSQTDIYEDQMQGVYPIINLIIEQNINMCDGN